MRLVRHRSKHSFSCGHPRSAANTRVATGRGHTWGRCRRCNNNYMRSYMRHRARQRLLSRIADLSRAVRTLKKPILD